MKPTGFELWRGLSPLNQQPIVAIATLSSSNRKTGNMVQVWILCQHGYPVDNARDGSDYAICGDCKHRLNAIGVRTCYVNPGRGPQSIYKAWLAGKYPKLDLFNNTAQAGLFKGRSVRWGAYGDPALLPICLINRVNGWCDSSTAYTHQWRQLWAQPLRHSMMASCDSLEDHFTATSLGWKTFNVLPPNAQDFEHAKQCPNTVANSQAQCVTCKLCDGNHANIWVAAHGNSKGAVTYV